MAPEVEDTAIPKTNRVDIWSLGCVLYRMLTGSHLFPTPRELYRYALVGSSPPPEVKNAGFSVSCVDFLGDVLQPEPDDRPSAGDCLKKAWVMSKAPGSECSVGGGLCRILSKIKLAAPDIDSFSDIIAHRAADNPLAGSFRTGATLVADEMVDTP